MSNKFKLFLFTLAAALLVISPALAQDADVPEAEIVNDEGGPVLITGTMDYTNPLLMLGTAQPVIILEDQAGFVDRNEHYLMPEESQVLGQITSDWRASPFTYSLSLPQVPQGTLRDVDQDDEEEPGVMVFTPAYWTNIFGDPYLEERDLFGGGWSTAYAGTRISEDVDTKREVTGGKYIIFAPEEGQGFPSGFGEDGLLFTEDDPIVIVPQGYTLVDMDSDPFTFDRSEEVTVNLIEPEGAAVDDFSDLSYTEAFDAMIEKMRKEYAFTEYKNIDWDALSEEFRPRFAEAEENNDVTEYRRALMEFTWAIPDGHIGTSAFLAQEFNQQISGGLGIAIRELDDGRVIVNFLLDGSPAAEEGIELGAEILEIDGQPVGEALSETRPWSLPFSTEHVLRLQQLRYVVRFPVDTEVELTYQNPGAEEATTTTLTAIPETESFSFSSFNVGLTGFEQPLDYEVLEDSGYAYAKIYSFSDNELLTVQLWERLMQELRENGVPGLIIDMRQNGGGSGFLADQMAAYFFNEPHVVGNTARYEEDVDEFRIDPRGEQRFYLPAEDLRYPGEVAVIIGPNCNSACEFFTYDMTVEDRAAIVGHYPTAGLGGSIELFFMPGGERVQFTIGRAVDADGNIHIEGKGVAPTVDVPVTEETLLEEDDPLLNAAIEHLNSETQVNIIEGEELAVGESVTGTLEAGSRAHHLLDMTAGGTINIVVESDIGAFVDLLDPQGNVLAQGTSPSDPGWEELEVPAGFTLVLEVRTEGDAGSGEYTLTIEPLE